MTGAPDYASLARELAALVGGVENVVEEHAADYAAAASVDPDELWTAVGDLAAGAVVVEGRREPRAVLS